MNTFPKRKPKLTNTKPSFSLRQAPSGKFFKLSIRILRKRFLLLKFVTFAKREESKFQIKINRLSADTLEIGTNLSIIKSFQRF